MQFINEHAQLAYLLTQNNREKIEQWTNEVHDWITIGKTAQGLQNEQTLGFLMQHVALEKWLDLDQLKESLRYQSLADIAWCVDTPAILQLLAPEDKNRFFTLATEELNQHALEQILEQTPVYGPFDSTLLWNQIKWLEENTQSLHAYPLTPDYLEWSETQLMPLFSQQAQDTYRFGLLVLNSLNFQELRAKETLRELDLDYLATHEKSISPMIENCRVIDKRLKEALFWQVIPSELKMRVQKEFNYAKNNSVFTAFTILTMMTEELEPFFKAQRLAGILSEKTEIIKDRKMKL